MAKAYLSTIFTFIFHILKELDISLPPEEALSINIRKFGSVLFNRKVQFNRLRRSKKWPDAGEVHRTDQGGKT